MSSSPKLLSKYARLVPVLALSIAAGACSGKGSAQSSVHDLMVVANKPNNLHLVDLTDRKVLRSCELPGKYGSGTVAMAPDKHTAYVISNQFENVYGVNLDTCELTFSAIQSAGNVRVKSIGSLAVSTDGTEVYTHQNPVRLLPDRYEVMDARIAVYKVADGLDAKPVRTFPAPRQVILLIPAADGKTLYMEKTCVACHGKDAKKPLTPEYPKLAGQNAKYAENQMKDIKSGARNNGQTAAMKGVMHLVNDEEIKAIADWLSKQK